MDDLGARLREARTRRGWTLETLSGHCGLSTGFLSQVERGLSTLSIVSLAAICRALDLPIGDLFVASGPLDRAASPVTAGADQLQIQIGDSPIAYRYLSGQLPEEPIKELLIAELPPGFRQDDSTHEGQELGYVLEGRLTLVLHEDEHELATGDSYRIEASEAHGYRTRPEVGAKVLMAVTQRFIEPSPKGT
ncbi:MAG: XRE family transcriptional regulator [Candidatus Bipolaricaulia bacterium]